MEEVKPEDLLEWAGKRSLVEVVWKLWRGEWPEESEREKVEVMMTLVVDQTAESPSARAVRGKASEGADLVRSVEAGVGAINQQHGGAVSDLAELLLDEKRGESEVVENYLREGKRLPGFGHRIYKTADP